MCENNPKAENETITISVSSNVYKFLLLQCRPI